MLNLVLIDNIRTNFNDVLKGEIDVFQGWLEDYFLSVRKKGILKV